MKHLIEIDERIYESNYDLAKLYETYKSMCKVLGFSFDKGDAKYEDMMELEDNYLRDEIIYRYNYNEHTVDIYLKDIIEGLKRIGLEVPDMYITIDNEYEEPYIEYHEEFVEWLEDRLTYSDELLIECLTIFDKELTITAYHVPSLFRRKLNNNIFYRYKE